MVTLTDQASITNNSGSAVSNKITGEVTQVILVWKGAACFVCRCGDIPTYASSIQNSGLIAMTDRG